MGEGNSHEKQFAATSHLAINPDPYRTRAAVLADDESLRVRALAEVVRLMCDHYDELRAVFGVKAGQIVRWPGDAAYEAGYRDAVDLYRSQRQA